MQSVVADTRRNSKSAFVSRTPSGRRKLLIRVSVLCCFCEVTSVWQAREAGELRTRGRLVEIGRWRKHARRRKNAKLSFLDERLFKTGRLHQVSHRDENYTDDDGSISNARTKGYTHQKYWLTTTVRIATLARVEFLAVCV